MILKTINPSKTLVEEYTEEELENLRKQLTYTDTSIQHQIKRTYNNRWFKSNNLDGWKAQIENLKSQLHNTLVFWGSDENDLHKFYIRPASLSYLKGIDSKIESEIAYPEPRKIAWEHLLPFELHPYQEESWIKLLEVRHGNVELCTGSGKSAILLKICRETGFRTAIIAPSQSIFLELLEKFEYHFGKGMVGAFGDGKKKLGKRFTICIGDSISNIKPGTEEWKFFSSLEMLCVDESHTWGADTLESICHGVLADVPYRFFFSGTQTRGDGSEKLLQSIIGPTVCRLTTKEAREKGYICDHDYMIVSLGSSNPNFSSYDALEMKRIHFLGNKNIAQFIANLANAQYRVNGHQSLILVEELSQIASIIPLLKIPFAYAHSEKRPDRLAEVGLQRVDKKESVDKFNRNEVGVLMGTSCISTGTNIYPTHYTYNWVGGASEIKTKQGAIGRSVRLGSQNPWANKCKEKLKSTICDFNVYDIDLMGKHLEERLGYYKDSGSSIRYVRLK